jgi:hypothetical protein
MPTKDDGRYWRVPRIWPGRTVFILGGGPSLKSVDVDRLRGQRVIAVNNAYKLGAWIDVVFFGDLRWMQWHEDGLRQFPGLKVSAHEGHLSALGRALGVRVVRKKNSPEGIFKDPALLAWNANSGACAINLAVHFGAKRIILLGFDMHKVDGQNNWHSEHKNAPTHDPYMKFLARFPAIAESLKRLGIECINATPGSALTAFPIVDPAEVLP